MAGRSLTLILGIVTLLWGGAIYAANFEDGVEAYVSGDFPNALRIFRLVAKQGHASAQVNLGVMYDNGQGVPEDDKEAVK